MKARRNTSRFSMNYVRSDRMLATNVSHDGRRRAPRTHDLRTHDLRTRDLRTRDLHQNDVLRNRRRCRDARLAHLDPKQTSIACAPGDRWYPLWPSWRALREALPLSRGHGRRARTLIWIIGSGLLLLWMLLVGEAYALWVAFGDWAVTQASDISRSAGPSELAGPIASLADRVRNLVGPTLAIIGIMVSAVILIVTTLTVRLLGGPTRP